MGTFPNGDMTQRKLLLNVNTGAIEAEPLHSRLCAQNLQRAWQICSPGRGQLNYECSITLSKFQGRVMAQHLDPRSLIGPDLRVSDQRCDFEIAVLRPSHREGIEHVFLGGKAYVLGRVGS